MGGTVQANDGTMIPLDSVPQQFIYDGSFLSSIIVQYAGKTFIQTFENDGTNIIYSSGWNVTVTPPGGEIMVDQSGDVMTDQSGNIMVTES